ncbi:MAG: A24 family peptidase [Pseudomonadota bacterium]
MSLDSHSLILSILGGSLASLAVPLLDRAAGRLLAGMDAAWARSALDWAETAGAPAETLSDLGALHLPAPAPLSPRILLILAVLAGVATTFALTAAAGAPAAMAATGLLALGLTLAILCDLRARLLPDVIVLPLAGLGLALATAGLGPPVEASLIGFIVGWGSLWSLAAGYRLVMGREGMGLGDAKLFGLAGAWAGWQALPAVAFLAVCISLIGLLIEARGNLNARTSLPFGPSLALSALIVMGAIPLVR